MSKSGLTYADAGVNIDAANKFIDNIKPLVTSTFRRGVVTELGGFAGLFALDTDRFKEPLLVASTDGVGTKLKLAFLSGKHDTVGIDLVGMCVNDIIVCGAQPLFMLDYFATGRLDEGIATAVLRGIADGCKEAECALIGGETAEMPGFYPDNEYDLAGFVVGVVERNRLIDGSMVKPGDLIMGLSSSGLHSNGFSLARKIVFDKIGLSVTDRIDDLGGKTVAEALLTPTRIYVKLIMYLIKRFHIKAMAHITGGGFTDNIPRVFSKHLKAAIHKGSWPVPAVFDFLQRAGGVDDDEMLRTFNCGIGMVIVIPSEEREEFELQANAFGEKVYVIGKIEKRNEGEQAVVFG